MKKVIFTEKAPKAIGPYSQAIQTGNMLFVSGQIPINPQSGEIPAGIKEQIIQVMENLKAILNEAGLGFENVVKSSIFLMSMGDFAVVNEVYGSYFTGDFPARETVQVACLPREVLVEISVIACI